MANGTITEEMAMSKISDAKALVARLNSLLLQLGSTNLKLPLTKRCEDALANASEASSEQATILSKGQLTRTLSELDSLLDGHFRIEPAERLT